MLFRYKIALTIFLLEAVIIVLVLWQTFSYLERELSTQTDIANKTLVGQLRQNVVKQAFINGNLSDLQYQLLELHPATGIGGIVIFDNDNTVLASSNPDEVGQQFNNIAGDKPWNIEEIEGAGGLANNFAYYPSTVYRDNAFAKALVFAITLALFGMIVVALVGMSIGTQLARRLEKIATSLSFIRDGRPEKYEVDESRDEVGQLSRFIYEAGKGMSSRMSELVDLEEYTLFALQAAGAGAWRWDMVNENLQWSIKNFQLMGYVPNKDKPSIRLWRSLVHPEDYQRVDFAIEQLVSEHKDMDVEYRIIRRSGEVRWMRSVGRMYFDASKQPTEVYGLQIDISHYKNIESNLDRQVFLLKRMLGMSSECIITLGAQQEILLCNATTLFWFGYNKGELFGRPFYELAVERERESLTALLSKSINSSDQLEQRCIVFTGLAKNDKTFPLQMKFEKYQDQEKYQRISLLISPAVAAAGTGLLKRRHSEMS